MCKELTEELERGRQAKRALAEHLLSMGADKCADVITVGNCRVRITAKRLAEPNVTNDPSRVQLSLLL